MPVFRGVDLGREEPQAPPPEPPFIPPWEEVGEPRPPGGMAQVPEGAGFVPPILALTPQQARVRAINRQPWGQLPAPRLIDPSRVSPRRFLAAAGRSLAGQLATLPAIQAQGLGPWLERMSEPPPGVVDGLMARSFAKMFVPSPEEMRESLQTPLGAAGFAVPPLAPAFRLPSNIGVGMRAAYGTTRRALAAAPGIPSRARLPIAGLKGVRGAAGELPSLTPLEEQIVRTYAGKTSADFTIRKVGQGATAAWKTFDKAGTDLGGVPAAVGTRRMAEGNLRRYIEFANEKQPRFAPPGQAVWPIMQEARRMGFDRPAREGVLQNLRKAVLAGEGDAPVMAWTRREGDWFVEVSTAGWSPARLARYGLEPAPDVRLPFGDAYRLRDVTPLLEAPSPIITEAAGAVKEAAEAAQWRERMAAHMEGAAEIGRRQRGGPPAPPDVPDAIMPGDFWNWRPDPVTGQMPPPPLGLGSRMAEGFSGGDPTLAMNLAQLFENRLNVLANLGNPAINRLLRWMSREHWNIGRDPNMVTSALQRKSANEMVVEAQTLAALPMDQKLAALAGYDRRTGNFGPAVQLRQGYEAAPSVLRNYNDVVARPFAYDMPESLRTWLADHQQLYHDAMAVPESQWGIEHRIKPNYVPGFWRPRKGPEGAKAQALWEQVKAAGGEHPKLQLGKEQAFEMEKVLANPQVAWENGFEIAPDARTFLSSYTLRSRASARAIGDAVGEQVARELGGDKVVQSLREYLGEASNPLLKAITRVSRTLVYPILGLDPIGIMASQMPVALNAELTRLPFDLLRAKRPLPTWRAFSAVLPGFISKYPLHGLALLKVAIPRMYSTESILEFVRSEADTIARMRQVGDDPFGTITGYSGATLRGRLGELANLPAKGQFQGILLRAHVNAFKNQSRRIKSMRELFTPEETARFLEEGPLPKALTERLKTSPDAFHDDWALGNHLANVYGGINKTKIAARPVTLALEQGLLAPGWARAKVGRYLMAGKMGKQGDLTREILIDALISYVLIGEAVSYKLSGEGMNLTHPDRGDWMGIRIGKGKWLNPQSGLAGAFRAVSAPIYRKIQTGKWNFREPVMYGLGQLNPAPTMPIEIARDQTFYGNEAITTLSENSLKSRFFYILRAEAPVAVQQFMDMDRIGTFGGVEAGLTAFSFNVIAPSQQQLLIREARLEAAVAAGVPALQARELARYGANPILAKDEDDKYVLKDQARSAASASAFRYASRLDKAITQDVYDSSGFPSEDNRRRQDERMRDFADRDQAASERHWERINFIGQQFEDTLAGKLTGDEALSPDGFRTAMRSETEAARKERWGVDAERNTYVRENNLQQWWKQRQDDGLRHKQRGDVARQAFLFGGEDVTGQQQPGILSIELYDHATGRTRYKERDALMAKWEMQVGEDTVQEWLASWRTAETHPLVQEYWDGLDRYEYYFEARDRVLAKASPVARQWFDARDKASDTRNRLRQNLIRTAWPAEAKAAEDRIEMEREYLRRTIPGLDDWLVKFGYRDKPVTEE